MWTKATLRALAIVLATGCAPPADDETPADLVPWRAQTGLYGFADRNGIPIIPAAYHDAQPFSEGRAAVASTGEDHLWGYIDRHNRWIVRPRFTHAPPFENGEARPSITHQATRSSFVAFLDVLPWHHGGYTVNYRINLAGDVREDEGSRPLPSNAQVNAPLRPEPRSGCSNGTIAAPPSAFVDGYALIRSRGTGEYGMIDRQCQQVVAFRGYTALKYPRHGFTIGRGRRGWGILDIANGREVITFDRASERDLKLMSEGDIVLAARDNAQQWTLFDHHGRPLCGGFRDVADGHENIIAVMDEGGNWGAVSSSGHWIFQPRYRHSFLFRQGLARIYPFSGGSPSQGEAFYVDRTGREFRVGGRGPEASGRCGD
jgi:hypothetical protein